MSLDLKSLVAASICPVCGYFINPGEPCRECADRVRKAQRDLAEKKAKDIKRLGGLKAYDMFTFAKYQNQAAIDLCAGYPACNLYIWGPAGVGKTHLATAIVRMFPDGRVLKPQQILRKMRGLKDGNEEEAVLAKIAAMPHLVIDDLGVEKTTAFSMSSLYEIIEARDMNYTKGLIVTSNLSLSALAERIGDDRIASRLAGMCRVVNITGEDRRIK